MIQVILNLWQENGTWPLINQMINHYDVRKEIISDVEVLKSNVCDYNDVYILVKVILLL